MPTTTDLTRLYAVATSLPPYTATQEHGHNFMTHVIEANAPEDEQFKALMLLDGIYESCGIRQRYTAIEDFTRDSPEEFSFFPQNWALEPFPTTAARMAIYEEMAVAMAEEAGRKALARSGFAPEDVTHLVVATCTGLFAPGPDILLVKRLGLRSTTQRTVIGFMGCYAGFNGLRMADQIVRADPDAVVLQVCVELCTLHYQRAWDAEAIVGNSLFADGAGAAVYAHRDRAPGGLADLRLSQCEITHDSLDQMQWHIQDHGFKMVLAIEVPATLERHARQFVDRLCDGARLTRDDVDHWAVHPGGPKIVDAIRDANGLDEAQVALSRSVLSDYGNMSSSTILFVLERHLEQVARGEVVTALGFGPGLTMEGAIMVGA